MRSVKLKNAILLFFIPAMFFLALAPFPAEFCSARAEAAVIKKIEVKDNLVKIGIDGPFTYTMYNTDPYKVTVEFPGVTAGSFAGQINPKVHGITSVNVADGSKSSKIQVLLDSPATVKPKIEGNIFELAIEAIQDPRGPIANTPAAGNTSITKSSAATNPAIVNATLSEDKETAPVKDVLATDITSLKFERKANSIDLIVTGNGTLKPRIFSLRGRIVVDLYGIKRLAPRPEEIVFPVKAVRSGLYPGKVRLVIDIKKHTRFQAMAKGDTLTIAMPYEEKAPEKKTLITAAGESSPRIQTTSGAPVPNPRQKISLDFEDAQIVPIFMLLGQVGGYNVVVHPSVQGTITLKLKDVPWEQALDILLDTFSLGKRIEGNVMMIAPLSQFSAWEKEKATVKEQTARTEDVVQEVIKLNYATAADVNSYISSAKLLSARGSITTDNRMNTLIIKDIPSQIDQIKSLVKIIDVAKPQVMIEAQIIEVDSSYTRTLGVSWTGAQNIGNGGAQNLSLSANTPLSIVSASATAPGGIGAFTLGTANALSLQLSVQALESVSHAKSLANPRVLTIDNEAASIQQGTSIPVQTTTAAGTTTQYVNANLNLSVTPRITPDGYVMLKIAAANDSLGQVTAQGFAINKKSVNTQALVKNGDTLVIGGIYTTNENSSVQGVPFLDRLPLIGGLFKTKTINGPNPSELLILITPRIVK